MTALRKIHRILFCQRLLSTNYNSKCTLSTTRQKQDHWRHCYDSGKDPAPIFFDSTVQKLLIKLSGRSNEKIFRHRLLETPMQPPQYEFMTEDMLKQSLKVAAEKADNLLQMPPVLMLRKEIDKVLSKDPAIAGYVKENIIFTDVSATTTERDRIIVVREPDGNLRLARWEERRRMNAIYNPLPYRPVFLPKLFIKENLQDALDREEYEYLLDNACYQLEPDDPQYHMAVGMTYTAIDERTHYESLRSTRHFGPMCFYLTWNRCSDNLLAYFLKNEMLSDAVDLIALYHTIHPNSKSLSVCQDPSNPIQFIQAYIENDCNTLQKSKVELALKLYMELIEQQKKHEEDLQRMHGIDVVEASS